MAQSRWLDLREILKEIIGNDNVYFSPPSNHKISYPCIVYQLSTGDTLFADNSGYRSTDRYQISLITTTPDCENIRDKISLLPLCTFDRYYSADNLNHYVYNLYY